MLPKRLENKRFGRYCNDSDWKEYLESIGKYSETIDHQFLSQICYEHYHKFNRDFPGFNIEKHRIVRNTITTKEIYNKIRYEHNEKLDFWYFHINEERHKGELREYEVLNYAIQNLTFLFPPVIIAKEFGESIGGSFLGSPIHLVEGTHRVSYINRLYEMGKIDGEKTHEILKIEP